MCSQAGSNSTSFDLSLSLHFPLWYTSLCILGSGKPLSLWFVFVNIHSRFCLMSLLWVSFPTLILWSPFLIFLGFTNQCVHGKHWFFLLTPEELGLRDQSTKVLEGNCAVFSAFKFSYLVFSSFLYPIFLYSFFFFSSFI